MILLWTLKLYGNIDPKSELLQLHLENQNSLNSSSEVILAQKIKESKLKTHGRGNYNSNYDGAAY